MLAIENITYAYKNSGYVLRDFSFEIRQGGVYGLLGRNGSGKSTLLYLISGLLTPGKGQVSYDGVNTRLRLPSTLSEMFLVPEEFALPAIPLRRFVELYSPFYPRFSHDDLRRYLEVFELDDNVNLGALSMGQKKKAFMSFALACNTRLLLMDEPSNGLDIPGKGMFRRAIAEAASDERVIIISTHQVRDIDRILDHILILNHSRIALDAKVDEITRRLSFAVTNDVDEARCALFASPSIGGTAIVTRNTTGDETELNLETLFGFVLESPEVTQKIFSEPLSEISINEDF